MDRAEEYLKNAERADTLAERASDPDIKRQLRDIAEQWRDLARQRESFWAGNSN